MAKGNKEKITLSFTRLERFLTKIAGTKIFEFEHLYKAPPPAKNPPFKDAKAASTKNESPRNLDR